MFLSLANLEEQFGKEIDPEIYDEVWSGPSEWIGLEEVYMAFNADTLPDDFRGHRLSVSDIVKMQSDDCTNFYYCNDIGWKRINPQTWWCDE